MTKAIRLGSAFTLTFVAFASGCAKSESDASSQSAAAEVSTDVKLKTFDYEVDKLMLTSLGRRIGCDQAARYVRFPKDGSLKNAIKKVMTSGTAYRSFRSELADAVSITAACGGAVTRETDPNAGIKHLLEVARKSSPCATEGCAAGLTFVMIGGLGGQFDGDGPWAESRNAWKEYSKGPNVPHRRRADGSTDSALRVWRLDADHSYRPDAENATNLAEKLAALEAAEPSSYVHQYFFVGYSKGGVTGIHMLGSSKELRDKTLGLMPVAAPLAGTVVFDMVGDSLKGPVFAHANMSGALEQGALQLLEQSPIAYLLGGALRKEDFRNLAANAADFTRGIVSLSVGERTKYLREWMPTHDFTRTSGKAIPVMQIAGLVDIVDLTPLPHVTYKDGKVTVKEGPNTLDDFKQTVFAPTFKSYPLSDTIVSLEHSALPREAFVNGLAPSLHAMLSLDHLRARMRPREGDPAPYLPIVDALMDSAATRIEAAQGGTR